MTYRENIERLKGRQRTNLSKRESNMRDRISFQKVQEEEMIDNIQGATDLVVGKPFKAFTAGYKGREFQEEGQGIFPTLYGKHVKDKHEEGKEAADKDREERLERMVTHFERLQDTDTAHHAVKRRMLLNGAYYDDADRFTQLSPHAQVGYAQQKLGLYKESYADKLKHWMGRNSHKYTIHGQTVTAEELHNNHLYPPLLKEAMLNEAQRDIAHQNGINGFSEEMLILAGINDYTDSNTGVGIQGIHSKAKADMMATYRKNYNIESSAKGIQLQFNEFLNNPDRNIDRFLTVIGGYVDKNNQMLDWTGAWTKLENLLIDARITGKIASDDELDAIFSQPIPGRPGKTYASEYGIRLERIKLKARSEKARMLDAENASAQFGAKEYENKTVISLQEGGDLWKWQQENGPITDEMVQDMNAEWEKAGGFNNGDLPPFLANIHTQQEQDQDKIYEKAKEILKTRTYLTEYDTAGANPATMKKIQELPGFNQSLTNAINSGEQFRTYGNKEGFEATLERSLRKHLQLNALDTLPPEWGVWYRGLENDYKATYRDLLHAGKLSPELAHDAALKSVMAKMGIIPDAKGKEVSRADARKYIEKNVQAYDLVALKKSNLYQAQRIDQGKEIIDRTIEAMDGDELHKAPLILLPTVGVDSEEWQQAKLYADTNGREGKIAPYYKELARLYPRFTAEDLINWQLKSGKHTGLKNYSSFYEAINSEGMREFHRLISYKPGSASTVQSKVLAIDVIKSLKLASQRAELNLEQPVRAPDDKSLIADKKRLSGIIKSETEPEITAKKEQGLLQPDINDPVFERETFAPGSRAFGIPDAGSNRLTYKGRTEYNRRVKLYEQHLDKLESERTTPSHLEPSTEVPTRTPPKYIWEMRRRFVIPKGTGQKRGWITEYSNDGGKTWTTDAPTDVPQDISQLQSVWNIPGSPVLSAHLQDYSVTLYNETVLNATAV